jgi:tRNA 2-thiouridine synthesizing protein A
VTTSVRADRTLDVRGQYCPAPVLRARDEIDKLESGQVLKLISDDPAAKEDITRWAKRTDHELLSLTADGRDITFLIRRA